MLLSRTKFLEYLLDKDYILIRNISLDWTAATAECEQAVKEFPQYWTSLIPEQVEAWDSYGEEYRNSLQNCLAWGYNTHNTRSWETTAHRPKLEMSWEAQCIAALPIEQGIARATCQPPGNTMPWHVDNFIYWKRNKELSEFVIRFIVFQEDWKIGQTIQAGNTMISHWREGDAITWHPSRWHLSFNGGTANKWTTAVTGILIENIEFDVNHAI